MYVFVVTTLVAANGLNKDITSGYRMIEAAVLQPRGEQWPPLEWENSSLPRTYKEG